MSQKVDGVKSTPGPPVRVVRNIEEVLDEQAFNDGMPTPALFSEPASVVEISDAARARALAEEESEA